MLREFIEVHREEILAQARERVVRRSTPAPSNLELAHGLPVFLDQLGEALRKSHLHEVVDHAEMKKSAYKHGDDLYDRGLTTAQVVHDYGDLCQVITGLAFEHEAAIPDSEFQTLNLCLDDAIADAVTAHANRRERAISDEGTERLGVLAHEMRNVLNAAMVSFVSIKKGVVTPGGSTGEIHERSLLRLNALIDRSLADVRLDAGVQHLERVPVWEIIDEVEIGATTEAQMKGLRFEVTRVDRNIVVEADRQILAAAVANLVQNALKFTRSDTTVCVRAKTANGRVLIEVEDSCGGLPNGKNPEALLRPFVQQGTNRTGLGLGLHIVVKAVKAMAGELHVRDLPGKGCIFTIDLPRQPAPPTSIHAREHEPADDEAASDGSSARSPHAGRARSE